jgi:septal ring factor EnvC (AmiA/AmiB activator)
VEWIAPVKDFWWLFGVLMAILAALWRLAIQTNKSKESLEQVATNKESIEALKGEIRTIKEDISDIKDGVDKQSEDMAAVLGALQSIMIALNDRNCDIGSARDKFNEYLAHR